MDELTQSNGGIVMPKGGKDAFLSKVTFRRESKWYSKTKQELKELKNMETIEERAKEAGIVSQYKSDYRYDIRSVEYGYIQGATEQKAIDIDKFCEWLRNNWRKYIYQDKDGMILFGHWESDFRKSMSAEE